MSLSFTPACIPSLTLPLQHSHASRWQDLQAFVHDALTDALHHPSALQGAQPRLRLLVSRQRLPLPPEKLQRQLETLSAQLQRLGVPHTVHQVVPGDAEPATHQLRISFQAAQ